MKQSATLVAVPESECDLIMKGGVTSGVVYPAAILRLASRYRFRSIGGTSAGAIAAACAAAAEFGRESGGFAKLDALRIELQKPGALLELFQPAPEAKTLLGFALEAQRKTWGKGRWRSALTAVDLLFRQAPEEFKFGAFVGGLLGILCMTLLVGPLVLGASDEHRLFSLLWWVGWCGAFSVGMAFIGAVAGATVKVGSGIRAATGKESLFGLCTGRQTNGTGPEALTDWLSRKTTELADVGDQADPITIGQLASKQASDGRDVGITFRMVTTNLSQQQPYTLPLDDNDYAFHESDFKKLFPDVIVNYLIRWGVANRHESIELPEGYYRFPTSADIPLVVATRMSLSFPFLLSAVRLFSINGDAFKGTNDLRGDAKPIAKEHLEENWFSDGGIASNFPIHMFDSWMPTRPTFGITLEEARPDTPFVLLPTPRDFDDVKPRAKAIKDAAAFARSIFGTAQNYRDTSQSALPSYRERIVQIGLQDSEGGLNLDMEPEVLSRIDARGREAADVILDEFDFTQHQWVRSLVLLARLEEEFDKVKRGHASGPNGWQDARRHYQALVDAQLTAAADGRKWYRPKDAKWCAKAVDRMNALIDLMEGWDSMSRSPSHRMGSFFRTNAPHPPGILRVTPEH